MDSLNPKDWIKKKKDRREYLSVEVIFKGIESGDRAMLSAGITLIESTNPEHRKDADELLRLCLPLSGNSIRIGVTGVPGVGKSTFIESFGKLLVDQGKKIAVLAIDPSSAISGGSILGDKTRMQHLSAMNEVFIRPSPAGDTLGGVARKTHESIVLCEAAGFNYILVETVGVGQSETAVNSMVDFFLLLMLSGAGDELQGIKKGIMEMADGIVITKADGDNEKPSKQAASQYRNALHLFPPNDNEWQPQVLTCSAIENKGMGEVVELIEDFIELVKQNGFFESNRKNQDKAWFRETLKEMILREYFDNPDFSRMRSRIEEQILNGELTSFQGAELLIKQYLDKHGEV